MEFATIVSNTSNNILLILTTKLTNGCSVRHLNRTAARALSTVILKQVLLKLSKRKIYTKFPLQFVWKYISLEIFFRNVVCINGCFKS